MVDELTAQLVVRGAQCSLNERYGDDALIHEGLYNSTVDLAQHIVDKVPVAFTVPCVGNSSFIYREINGKYRLSILK
jgi:hypothetical protein